MRSRASVLALISLTSSAAFGRAPAQVLPTAPPRQTAGEAAVPLPPEAGQVDGPRATAGAGAPSRYDEVGLATWYGEELSGNLTASGAPFRPQAITAAHRTLPLGSYAEVTALETGRTILVLINDRGPGRRDRLIDLSRGAAELLGTGTNPKAPVRIRTVSAGIQDRVALAAGRAAAPRLDAPPALLVALRRKLAGQDAVSSAPPRSLAPPAKPATAKAKPAPAPRNRVAAQPAGSTVATHGRYLVQVAAFSSESRARALARRLAGRVEGAAGIWRVRLGPFADAATARRARDAAARQGYGDAAIITP